MSLSSPRYPDCNFFFSSLLLISNKLMLKFALSAENGAGKIGEVGTPGMLVNDYSFSLHLCLKYVCA